MDDIKQEINKSSFIKIHIDVNCVIGWSKTFYHSLTPQQIQESKKTKYGIKDLLFKGLKNPSLFSCFDYIYSWEGSESDFKYILDILNDPLNKERLGAYYTPIEYASLSTQMLKNIIAELPQGRNYLILDRCAGTGNLESLESGFSNEMLSHTILATFEYKEWEVLVNRLGNKVLGIIPSDASSLQNGLLKDGDALNRLIFKEVEQYVNDPNTTIILLENPPYHDAVIGNHKDPNDKERSKQENKESLIYQNLKQEMDETKPFNVNNVSTARDSVNLFIWSGFKYYLKKPDDYYILYSPIKYWKSIHLIDKQFIDGYLFNRKHFHAGLAGVSCIAWKNIDAKNNELSLKTVDIDNTNNLTYLPNTTINKVFKNHAVFYDKDLKYDNSHLGYLFNNAFGIDFKHSLLTNYLNSALSGMFTRGTWLTKDNFFKQIIPLIASTTSLNEFYDKEVLMKCADNGTNYLNDEQLKLCSLIYVSLSKINHCKSFYLDKSNFKENEVVSKKQNGNQILVINELAISCNDTQTFINELLQEYKIKYPALFFPALNNILALWEKIMNLAKQTKNYNKDFAYSLNQIDDELNTYKEIQVGKTIKKQYDYVLLNSNLESFKKQLENFYKLFMLDKIKKYGLIK